MQKLKRKLIRFRKKNSGFPENLRAELEETFSITQKVCHHTEFYHYVNSVTTKFKGLTQDVFEKCCPSIEKNILMKGECDKWYNTESKIPERNMRHTKNNHGQNKTNEMKHNEFR